MLLRIFTSLLVSALVFPCIAMGQQLRNSYDKEEEREKQAIMCVKSYYNSHLLQYKKIYDGIRLGSYASTITYGPNVQGASEGEMNDPYLTIRNGKAYLTYWRFPDDKCRIEMIEVFELGKVYNISNKQIIANLGPTQIEFYLEGPEGFEKTWAKIGNSMSTDFPKLCAYYIITFRDGQSRSPYKKCELAKVPETKRSTNWGTLVEDAIGR